MERTLFQFSVPWRTSLVQSERAAPSFHHPYWPVPIFASGPLLYDNRPLKDRTVIHLHAIHDVLNAPPANQYRRRRDFTASSSDAEVRASLLQEILLLQGEVSSLKRENEALRQKMGRKRTVSVEIPHPHKAESVLRLDFEVGPDGANGHRVQIV